MSKESEFQNHMQYLTVMMNDVRGFTSLSERMSVTDFMNMLNHYLSIMTDVITKYNGKIIEFTGDGILAIFGENGDNERHADDAVAASVAMQNKMQDVNQWNHLRDYPDLEMGVGLHTGEAIIGMLGCEHHWKYGVVGRTVNMASRLEGYTVGGQILISQATREACHEPLHILKEIQVLPKGSKDAMTVSDVAGIGGVYGLECRTYEEPLQVLKDPCQLTFQWINGKHASATVAVGRILELSYTGALISSEQDMAVFDNLQLNLDIGEYLYGKVVMETEQGWIMRFTSRPVGFKKWLWGLLNGEVY